MTTATPPATSPSPGAPTPASASEPFSLTTLLWTSLFFALTLWIFGPAHIYFTNSLEFSFTFSRVLPYLAAASLLTVLAPVLILWLMKSVPAFYGRGVSLLLAGSVLLWVQGNLLVWHYGPLDGREIHWGEKLFQGIFDGGLWLLLVVLALVKWRAFYRVARKAAMAFIVIQLISIGFSAFQAPAGPGFKYYRLDDSRKYTFSKGRNVILLVLDTFQSDLFQEILNEEEEYREMFRGFTYFRNTLSAFPKTYTSVPSFLTARPYDNSVPMQDYIRRTYGTDSALPTLLKGKGYRVELYPYPGTEKTIHFDTSVASNLAPRGFGGVNREHAAFLTDISLFRGLPHVLKRFVYNKQHWLLKRVFRYKEPEAAGVQSKGSKGASSAVRKFSKQALKYFDIRFTRDLLHNASLEGNQDTFKFFHLNGLHRPLVLDRDLEVKEMSYSERSSFKTQGTACLEITRLFLEKLKALGIYDDALIIVMADHGCADYPYGVKLEAAGLTEPGEAPAEGAAASGPAIPAHIKASGLPMLLVKPVNAGADELNVSDAPVSLTDLPATVLQAAGIPPAPGMPGTPVFSIDETTPRRRTFYYHNWSGWHDGYLYHMQEYRVEGHGWLDESWSLSGMKAPASAEQLYVYGTEADFRKGGNGRRFQGVGWHGPGKRHTWSREKRATLYFSVTPPRTDLFLRLTLRPYLVPGKWPKQEVRVSVNGKELQRLKLSKKEMDTYEVRVPKELAADGSLTVTFDIPTAVSPVDLGIGDDVRTLGIALQSLRIDTGKSRE